jgi:purine-binding chemotaxis protein CheW
MQNPSKEKNQGGKARTAESSVWVRLREQMERLDSARPAETDPQGLADRLAARAKQLRQRMERPRAEETRVTFLAFSKQKERYGIPLEEVAAVESLEHFTPVPGVADFIRGVTPWRGSILSLIDLGRLFGRPETGISDLRVCVIVETAGRRLAVVAHEVEEIISVSTSQLPAAPDLPANISPDWIIGVHDENRLILRMHQIVQDDRIAAWRK